MRASGGGKVLKAREMGRGCSGLGLTAEPAELAVLAELAGPGPGLWWEPSLNGQPIALT